MLVVANYLAKNFVECPVCNKYYLPIPSYDLKRQKTEEELIALEKQLKRFDFNIKVGIACYNCYKRLDILWI